MQRQNFSSRRGLSTKSVLNPFTPMVFGWIYGHRVMRIWRPIMKYECHFILSDIGIYAKDIGTKDNTYIELLGDMFYSGL